MLPVFESILPIFMLIMTGVALKRLPLVSAGGWTGIEQASYWFLYPSLIFVTIVNADFSGLSLNALLASLTLSAAVMIAILLALWPLLKTSGLVEASEFSSVFQTAIRWNGFMALAIAQNMFPPEATAVVALAMAAIVLPINVVSVLVITRFADGAASWRGMGLRLLTNPLIVACIVALLVRWTTGLYEPINDMMRLAGNAAIGLGLLSIGAGLRLGDLGAIRFPVWLPVFLKLALFPALAVAIAIILGVPSTEIQYVALCAGVPTALNGYLLARQLGGDADLYAAVTTTQTALAFFTIPVVLTLTAQLST